MGNVMTAGIVPGHPVRFMLGDVVLSGELALPGAAQGLVVFVHGSGSSRFSPRNQQVARYFNERGLATLLFDLLGADEQHIDDITREYRFDIALLVRRLVQVVDRIAESPETSRLALGLFGASTGAAAALIAAARRPSVVKAVVSRGGRVDLADSALPEVLAPTLMIVGGKDEEVLALNRSSSQLLSCIQQLAVVQGASHLFEEPGMLEQVAALSADWFRQHLVQESAS